jgi:UDP-GlcNAc:undecaprenyl-phosphate GlcNAc-1-phosphate transferase
MGVLLCALVISIVSTGLLVKLGARAGTLDSAGVAGQHKVQRSVPNIGGIAIMLAMVLPMIGAAMLSTLSASSSLLTPGSLLAPLAPHISGLASVQGPLIVLIASVLALHAMGLVDDRRPMKAWPKLLLMALPAIALALTPGTRLLTALDSVVGGSWLSLIITVIWFLVITNALNFLDNMDGLSAGVAGIASGVCMVGALTRQQWFVAVASALVCGACIGFLFWNFPWRKRGALIFMGDGGSLLLGFMLALISVRGTYASVPSDVLSAQTNALASSIAGNLPSAWYVVLTPLVMLAVPLYDFVSVCVVRLRAGRSPMMGDRNHLSHRLTRRGLSPRNAVLTIYALTAITGCSALLLPSASGTGALLIAAQVAMVLAVVAMLEFGGASPLAAYPNAGASSAEGGKR